jgi:ribosome-associated toxin RatA of RatAB toxin-antitoxin module
MPTFEAAIDIRAGADALFDLTQDYDRRLDWDPFLKEARLVGGATAPGIGVRAWCVARSGLGMETEYVSFQRPQVAAVKMTRGPAMFGSFAGSWRFKTVVPDTTRVVFRYHVTARPTWLRRVLDPIFCLVFERDVVQRLEALKRFAETTELVPVH